MWNDIAALSLCPSLCKLRRCSIYCDWLSKCQHCWKATFGFYPGAAKNSGKCFIAAAVLDVNHTAHVGEVQVNLSLSLVPCCIQGGNLQKLQEVTRFHQNVMGTPTKQEKYS